MFTISQIRWHCETQDKLEYVCFYEIGCDNEVDEIELMQWTGLQDNASNDVYEGDILKIDNFETEIGYVRFDCGSFYVEGVETEYCGISHFTECPDYKVSIIGNIYENPELMNG